MTITTIARRITGGVDTHLDVHVAAALDERGALLGVESFPTTPFGYRALLNWLETFGTVELVGVEGTGSYGAGLTRHLLSHKVSVVEVDRPNRQRRRRTGKSDPEDAVAANTGSNCYSPGGSFTSLGYNLTDDTTGTACGFTQPTDVVNAKPGLGPLTDNGGPTLTQLPAANGPAVGVIPAGTKLNGVKVCPRIDQRGVASVGKCTIGAVEQHGVWPSQVQGYPAFPVKDSPPPGFLIGVQDGVWKLYSHNLSGTDIFTGTITTNGTFSDVALTSNDSGDKMTMLNAQTISFGFHTAGYVSGIKFVSSGSQVTFHNLEEDGTLVPPADILLGSAEASATSNPLTITRP